MSFVDILRKLGIFRSGAKAGTYTSGKNMPAEFLMNDVFNADKDLVSRQDVKTGRESSPCKPKNK